MSSDRDKIIAKSDEIKKMLMDGESISFVARSLGLDTKKLYTYARNHIGWDKSWRKENWHKNGNFKTSHYIDKVIRLREEGYTLASIGEMVGVTRQRIEQVCKKAGVKSYTEIKAEEKAKKAKIIEKFAPLFGVLNDIIKKKKAIERHDKLYNKWRYMIENWDNGIPLKDLAKYYGTTINTITQVACRYRSEYGWFKPRKKYPYKGMKMTDIKSIKDKKLAIKKAIDSGLTYNDIQALVKCSPNTISRIAKNIKDETSTDK